MKITEDWIKSNFVKETDEHGELFTRNITDCGTLALMSDDERGFTEVMLFPYHEIRFQTTEQVEECYKSLTGESFYSVL